MTKKKSNISTQQTLDRALELLNLLATTDASMSVNEIAQRLEVTRPTVYSMISSLMSKDFIEKDEGSGKYSLGHKVYILGNFYIRQQYFLYATEMYVLNLIEKWKKRVNIAVLKPPLTAVIILSRDVTPIPRLVFGCAVSAHNSAIGKALLAYQTQEYLNKWINEVELPQYTDKTITNKLHLLEMLALVRKNGYATDNCESLDGKVCIAAPIYDSTGEVIAAISISDIDKENYDNQKELFISDIKYAAMSISIDLGYNRDLNILNS